MPFSANFSTSQLIGLPNVIRLTDTSTGSDSNITERRIYFIKSDGTYLVPSGTTTDYVVWDYSLDEIDVDILDKDYALNIRVDFIGTPPPIPQTSLWAWYDAALDVTGTTTVTAWGDQSGNDNNLSASSGQEPTLVASVINSLPVIRPKAGVAAKMVTTDNFPTGALTVFIVASQTVAGSPLADTGGAFMGSDSDGFLIYRDGSGNTINAISSSNLLTKAATNGTFYVTRYTVSGNNRTLALNNGTPVSDTQTPSGGSGVLNVFDDGFGDFGNKQIAEIIIYEALLSGSDITTVEDYLNAKYAIY